VGVWECVVHLLCSESKLFGVAFVQCMASHMCQYCTDGRVSQEGKFMFHPVVDVMGQRGRRALEGGVLVTSGLA